MSVTDNSPIDEAEWQAQERALRPAPGHATHQLDASYRLVANALRSSPRSEPPVDFAADVAGRVVSPEAGFESLLSRILMAAFVVLLAITGAIYGGELWQALGQEMGDGGSAWILAVVACVALSWFGGRLLGLTVNAGRRTQAA